MENSNLVKEIIYTNSSSVSEDVLHASIFDSDLKIVVEEGVILKIIIDDLLANKNISIDVKKDANLRLSFLAEKCLEHVNIVINLSENAYLDTYFADFSSGVNDVEVDINLNEKHANAHWHLASLSSNKDKKSFPISIYHHKEETYGRVDNYGVCKDSSKLIFKGTNAIYKGSHGSITKQNAKIMVFDENSDAIANPILKIDENDIEASHGAAVGKINDDYIFYLTSRGLTTEMARSLITLGYLKPILTGFDDNYKTKISLLIEGRL